MQKENPLSHASHPSVFVAPCCRPFIGCNPREKFLNEARHQGEICVEFDFHITWFIVQCGGDFKHQKKFVSDFLQVPDAETDHG